MVPGLTQLSVWASSVILIISALSSVAGLRLGLDPFIVASLLGLTGLSGLCLLTEANEMSFGVRPVVMLLTTLGTLGSALIVFPALHGSSSIDTLLLVSILLSGLGGILQSRTLTGLALTIFLMWAFPQTDAAFTGETGLTWLSGSLLILTLSSFRCGSATLTTFSLITIYVTLAAAMTAYGLEIIAVTVVLAMVVGLGAACLWPFARHGNMQAWLFGAHFALAMMGLLVFQKMALTTFSVSATLAACAFSAIATVMFWNGWRQDRPVTCAACMLGLMLQSMFIASAWLNDITGSALLLGAVLVGVAITTWFCALMSRKRIVSTRSA